MPELPEVETVKNGLMPHILKKKIKSVSLYRKNLRYPFDPELNQKLSQQIVHNVSRRGKHLILQLDRHSLIIHLGMSGSLQIADTHHYQARKHDHVSIAFSSGNTLFYNDPRRFGYWLVTEENPLKHRCFFHHGPEPLSEQFTGAYLHCQFKSKKQMIKAAIMDNANVVGVGNIYACESLFKAKIHPKKTAMHLSLAECHTLVQTIKDTLHQAIQRGGTSLKDYKNAEGKPGYFAQNLKVYGRKDHACYHCAYPVQAIKISQRSTFYCPHCQKLA